MINGNFLLNKWFLDFVGDGGETMIFYSAKLTWHGLSVPYTSWLYYNPQKGVSQKSRFQNIQMPQTTENIITWSDSKFDIKGTWKAQSKMLQTRIFDSEEGYLDWKCLQPSSRVYIHFNNRTLKGNGYVEQLLLTALPWKIPMDELRWGRFVSNENHIVWIELRQQEKRQWLWLNGKQIDNCLIEDDQISIPEKDLILKLDKDVVLESEKKIYTVVEKLIPYIPGFNKVMPMKFLMADEIKWLSKGLFQKNGKTISTGYTIHEFVKFKGH